MENRNDIEELEQLLQSIFRDVEQQPPADTWQRVSEALSSPSSHARWHKRWYLPVGLTAAALAITTAVVLAWPRPGNDVQQAVAVVPAISQPPAGEAPTPVATALPTQPCSDVHTMPLASPASPQPMPSAAVAGHALPADEPYENNIETETPAAVEPQQHLVASEPVNTTPTETPEPTVQSPAPAHQHEKTAEPAKSIVELQIPTLLTPNGDGYNDCWIIGGLDQYSHVEVAIYTARSQRVYSSSDYGNDFCGDDLPKGNYFYVVAIKSERYVTRGVLVVK